MHIPRRGKHRRVGMSILEIFNFVNDEYMERLGDSNIMLNYKQIVNGVRDHSAIDHFVWKLWKMTVKETFSHEKTFKPTVTETLKKHQTKVGKPLINVCTLKTKQFLRMYQTEKQNVKRLMI